MALFFTITLLVSIAGMVLLLALKRWELATGRMVTPSVRPVVGGFFHTVGVWAEHVAPALVRHGVAWGFGTLRRGFHRAVAWSVLLTERGLEQALRSLRRKTELPRANAEASEFLREVAEHKKQIQRSVEERVIFDE